MKRTYYISLVTLIFVTLACGGTAPAGVSDQSGIETIVAATLQAVTQTAESKQPSQPTGIEITYQNISFTIPDGLATGAKSETVPSVDESGGGPWGVAPEYIQFTLADYPVVSEGLSPVIRIYPAKEYADVNPWAASSLEKLQAILTNPSTPLTNENLSSVPFKGAAEQHYAAQAKLLILNNGNGVRMLSQYGQFPGRVINNASFYHYEGLSNDGKYMITIVFPIVLPLQSTVENPEADGVPYPSDPIQDETGINAYYQGITDILNAASPDSFQPNLNTLDMLVQSIQIK
ncbi:MAG: hypothetical protein IPG80_02180 [Anaerolineales bacterium]|uniref:hypothetical protein n=1 Tax=Candidatus Villigracilis vicinus TaxID=3140679 RepID=UPI003136700C|nr:hypothetical protein [Anaerolineales bacterium]